MEVERRIEQLVGRQLVLELPAIFENHRVEVIVLTLDDQTRSDRRPHPAIAGKMKIHGEIFDSAPEGTRRVGHSAASHHTARRSARG